VDAVAAVDGALARLSGTDRAGGVERLRALRMHAWQHELGAHVAVLARCYGGALTSMVATSGSCPSTRRDATPPVPAQRRAPGRVVLS
jgi:hypothetical protein